MIAGGLRSGDRVLLTCVSRVSVIGSQLLTYYFSSSTPPLLILLRRHNGMARLRPIRRRTSSERRYSGYLPETEQPWSVWYWYSLQSLLTLVGVLLQLVTSAEKRKVNAKERKETRRSVKAVLSLALVSGHTCINIWIHVSSSVSSSACTFLGA